MKLASFFFFFELQRAFISLALIQDLESLKRRFDTLLSAVTKSNVNSALDMGCQLASHPNGFADPYTLVAALEHLAQAYSGRPTTLSGGSMQV